MFWEVFQERVEEPLPQQEMSLEEIQEITKGLVEDRKKINQKLELLLKEIDLNSAKLESLKLVGGDVDTTLNRINELNDLGQNMADALLKLDEQLKVVREEELRVKEEMMS